VAYLAWIGPKWETSWHNFAPEVTADFAFPEKIQIEDWTLEGDGEDMPGIVFTGSERIEIARALDGMHVHRMNAGFVTSLFHDDVESIKTIVHLGLDAKVAAKVSASKADIDLALTTDLSEILMELPSSDAWIESINQTRSSVIEQSIETTSYAKEHGLRVTFGVQDATRADAEFLRQYVTALDKQAHVDGICLADSWAVASPYGFGHLVKMVKSMTKLPISIHCHNDFGLATANALAGLSAGASMVTTTVNGIGERCGLSSLEEVVLALRLLYNIDTGIRYDRFCILSRIVEKATGSVISDLKPIVGKRAFALETDDFLQLLKNLQSKEQVKSVMPYEPDLVGNDFAYIPGRKTGELGVKWEAERLGIKLNDQQVLDAVLHLRKLSKAKQRIDREDFLSTLARVSRSL
jgi:isopropylmalate/homocitrate/citramalate synthase